MPKSIRELQLSGAKIVTKEGRRRNWKTRTWVINSGASAGAVMSYSVPPVERIRKARQRAIRRQRERDETHRSLGECFTMERVYKDQGLI